MEKELREHNLRLLEETVRKSGFPEEILGELRDMVRAGNMNQYYLAYLTQVEQAPARGFLFLERFGPDDPYEWKNFYLELDKEHAPLMEQNNFLVGHGYDTTLREAYNLLQGRFVYKEPSFDREAQSYWVSLDIGQHNGYWDSLEPGARQTMYAPLNYQRSDFHIEAALTDAAWGVYLTPERKKELTEALKQGDRKEVELSVMGTSRKVWAEAAPIFKSIRLSDAKGKTVNLPELIRGQRLEAVVQKPIKRRPLL